MRLAGRECFWLLLGDAFQPGEVFNVCVTVTVRVPLLPDFIDANTATGQFVVERDRYADG